MITGNPLVSIVDDDASVRRSLKRLLESEGCEVECFAGAEYFLSATRFREPACILLDLNMGAMGGDEMAVFMKELGRSIPILIVTGSEEEVAARCAAESDAYGYLLKPVDPGALLDAVQAILDEKSAVA